MGSKVSMLAGLLFLGLWAMPGSRAYAQGEGTGEGFRHELRATTVNDSYFSLRQDHYYTNGLKLGYKRLLKPEFSIWGLIPEQSRKLLFSVKVAHQVYTPKFIQNDLPERMDRPYAGYLYMRGALHSFWKERNRLRLGLTVGVIGPASGAEQVQSTWHEWFGLPRPRGWEYQIRNEPVINLTTEYARSWPLSSAVDVMANAGLRAGTGFNDFSAGLSMRFGNIHPIDQSAMTDSQLGGPAPGGRKYNDHEWFLFLGFQNRAVIHNTLIDGGLISPSSASLDRETEPYFNAIEWGGAYSLKVITWKLVMSRLSPEVVEGEPHILVSFDMAVRF